MLVNVEILVEGSDTPQNHSSVKLEGTSNALDLFVGQKKVATLVAPKLVNVNEKGFTFMGTSFCGPSGTPDCLETQIWKITCYCS